MGSSSLVVNTRLALLFGAPNKITKHAKLGPLVACASMLLP